MKGKVKNIKKVDLYPNNKVVLAMPPEPIDESEPICLLDYLIPGSRETNRYCEKVRRFGEDRELTDVNELTPTIVNSLIDRIEVHNNDKSGGHCYVKIDINFSAVGMIDIPTTEEIRAMIEEIKKDPQQFRYVA